MGSITEKTRENGTKAFTGHVLIKRAGKIVYRKAKTLDSQAAAQRWINATEAEMSRPGAIEALTTTRHTLADAIDKYVETHTGMGRTKEQVLRSMRAMPIAGKDCASITSADLVALVDELGQGRKPQTVGNYMSHLQSVFAIAEDAWGMPLDLAQMTKAMRSTRRLGTVTRSATRDRRPTLDELDRILTHFQQALATGRAEIPMAKLTVFALFSTRRQEEISRILWSDYEGDRVLVRDMKHPGQKVGNNVWCNLPPEAARVIDSMPRTEARIFPYDHRSVSAAFTRACQFLGISGDNVPEAQRLHFHDLRHEGISRLSEMGWTIQQVTQVSGHRSLASLTRYTHMRQSGDKYAAWPWLERVTAPPTHPDAARPELHHTPQPEPGSAET